MIESFVAKFALKALLNIIIKHPWSIIAIIAVMILPIYLIGNAVGGVSQALTNMTANKASCSEEYRDGVNKLFGNDANSDDASKVVEQSGMLKECPPAATTTAGEYLFVSQIWYDVQDQAQALADSKAPYNQSTLDGMLDKLLNQGVQSSLSADELSDTKDEVKADWKKLLADNDKKSTVWQAVVDYVDSKLASQTYYNGDFVSTLLAAARSRIGKDYVLGGSAGTWNTTAGCYEGTNGLCGFDCARLVGYAYAVAKGLDVTKTAWQTQLPYGSTGATDQRAWLLAHGAQVVPASEAAPGDFIYLSAGDGTYSHVAIYAGIEKINGVKTQAILEAPHPGAFVREWPNWMSGSTVSIVRAYASDNKTAAQQYASSQLSKYGWDQSQYPCLFQMWTRESGWSSTINGQWTTLNGQRVRAYGIPQALPGNKMADQGSDWRTNYKTQVDWGLGYIKDRYHSPCEAWTFWQAHQYY